MGRRTIHPPVTERKIATNPTVRPIQRWTCVTPLRNQDMSDALALCSKKPSLHCRKETFQQPFTTALSQQRRESFSSPPFFLQNVCMDVQKTVRMRYQIWQMLGRTILSVAAHLKAVRNSGMLESVPMRRYLSSGCGSVEAR